MDLTVNQRLRDYLEFKKISFESFRKSVNVGRIQHVSAWMASREKIPDRVLIETIKVYEDLEYRWLLFGEGSMLKSDVAPLSNVLPLEGISGIYKDYVSLLLKMIKNLEETIDELRRSKSKRGGTSKVNDIINTQNKSSPELIPL